MKQYEMIIIWICLGFIPLQVSSSYLLNINFDPFGLLLTGKGLVQDNAHNSVS